MSSIGYCEVLEVKAETILFLETQNWSDNFLILKDQHKELHVTYRTVMEHVLS